MWFLFSAKILWIMWIITKLKFKNEIFKSNFLKFFLIILFINFIYIYIKYIKVYQLNIIQQKKERLQK